MRFKHLRSLPLALAGAGFLAGLLGTALWSAEDLRRAEIQRVPLSELTRLEPIRVGPRAELLVLTLEARAYLESGRPWAAWRLLRDAMDDPRSAPAGAVLLAARAAGEWGGWKHTRALLEEQPWLTRADEGEGLFLLARAEEELGDAEAAAAAYRRYLALAEGRRRGDAAGRLGGILREAGDARGAADAFAVAAESVPEVSDWLYALRLEQLAAAGDTTVTELATRGTGGSAPVRQRRVEAEVSGWRAAGDEPRALRRLEWESRVLAAQGGRVEAARLNLRRADLLRALGREAEARELLRSVAWDEAVPGRVRMEAAEELGGFDARSAAEELARAGAFEAADKPGLAARALRAALAAGAADDGGLRLKLARLLYRERDYAPARAAFEEAASRLRDPELRADAELHAARALFRGGGARDRARAAAGFREVVERYPGTAAAGTALFLLGDEAATTRGALSYYRRAAEVGHSPDAREALYRAGDRSLKLDDPAGAIRHWEEYVRRYPRGEETAQVAYEVARLHHRAGRRSRAQAMYTAATLAEPVSYAAVRAASYLGLPALRQVLSEPRPYAGLAADAVEAANVVRRLETLRRLGLDDEWEAELDAAIRSFEDRPAALITLAEGIRDQGHTVPAIRLGYRILEKRGGEWDARLLRVVFPLSYREILEREAARSDVDPMLLAALVRQESSFRPDARSWVGATGLGQIMPATGKWLAPSVGVRSYDPALLEVPEVNLRMSARYLGDLLDRYDGARDLALAGYNAGPGRADRWRRTLGYGGDPDRFRDRIPFDETRHYVKVVLRNEAIYRALYAE